MAQPTNPEIPTGIYARHAKRCPARVDGGCKCEPRFQAQVWVAVDNKPLRRTFDSLTAARNWRQEAQIAVRHARLRGPTETTVEEAASEWLELAERGIVRTRGGDVYKRSAIRSYRGGLRRYVLPRLGNARLSAITRNRIQDVVDEMVVAGLAPNTVRNAVLPLRAIYRRALSRSELSENPTINLDLPAIRTGRDRVARPAEAEALVQAVPARDRALWAMALYAGLRLGELQALDWQQVDLEARLIRVERGWDRHERSFIAPKSRSGRRRVPMSETLRHYLLAHRLLQGQAGQGRLFVNDRGGAFDSSTVTERARRAWAKAGLEAIGLHECRHTFASLMIAAGVNFKALSAYMGHAGVAITLDRYGHLLPGNEVEAAGLLDAFLARHSRGGGRGATQRRFNDLAGE